MDRRKDTAVEAVLEQLIEHGPGEIASVFGQIKQVQGADSFMMRGDEEARGEWSLHCAGHNLRKLHSESVRRGRRCGKWLLN